MLNGAPGVPQQFSEKPITSNRYLNVSLTKLEAYIINKIVDICNQLYQNVKMAIFIGAADKVTQLNSTQLNLTLLIHSLYLSIPKFQRCNHWCLGIDK